MGWRLALLVAPSDAGTLLRFELATTKLVANRVGDGAFVAFLRLAAPR